MSAMRVTPIRGIAIGGALMCLAAMLVMPRKAFSAPPEEKTPHKLIEKASFDWNHTGEESTFRIFREKDASDETFDRLTIETPGQKLWSLQSQNGKWISISEPGLNHLNKRNLLPTSRRLFFASSNSPQAKIYLILKGEDSGCCVGSLTVLTPNEQGQPKVVFQASSHLLAAVESTGNGEELKTRFQKWSRSSSLLPGTKFASCVGRAISSIMLARRQLLVMSQS